MSRTVGDDVLYRIAPTDQLIYDTSGNLVGIRNGLRAGTGADFRVETFTEAATATPTSSSTVLGETGGTVKRFAYSFTQSGTGAVARTHNDKLLEFVSVLDYCSAAQKADILGNVGAVDVSDAWQAALDAVSENGQVDLVGGTHLLSSAVSQSNKARIRIIGRGAVVKEAAPVAALVTFDNCDRLRVDDVHFEGTEDYTYFAANSPTTRARFLVVKNSDRVRIRDVTGEAKRGHIYLESCNASVVECSDFVGFFQNVSLGAQANANECPSVEFSGGRHNKALHCHAENHGSVVLWGLDGIGHTAFDCTGMNLHDNGVYGSSGTRGRAFACDFSEVIGSAVKMRGSKNIIVGNTATTTYTGAAFVLTGNGVTPDSFGANGSGNIAIGNSASDIARDGFSLGAQDGYYGRDSIVAFNAICDITGTGGYAAINATLTQGAVLAGNVASELACDYGVLLAGSASLTQKACAVFGNVTANLTGAQQGVRVQYLTESLIAGNVGTTVTNLVQGRFVTDSVYLGNVNPNGTTALGSSSANSNSGNVVIGHRGTSSFDANTHAGSGNFPAGSQHSTAVTPVSIGQTTVSAGEAYIAVDVSASTDWKKITP